MSYAHIPSLGASAEAEINVSAMIEGQPILPGAPALPTPKATFDQIVATSPDLQSIRQDWGPSLDIAGKLGMKFPWGSLEDNPSLAVEFMMGALPTLLQAAGIDGAPADIVQVASGFAPQVGALVRGHPGPLVMAGIKTGASYGCQQLGIPPDIGNITIDAVAAGELTDKTLIAAGGLGGAIGGSAICGLIGVPPCIGGYVGGFAGKLAGGAIAGVLSIGGGSEERERKRKEHAALVAAIRGQLGSIREQYVNFISLKRGEWWATFDRIIDNVSYQWQALECSPDTKILARFPLLWSGTGNVDPFFLYPFGGALVRCPAINRNLSRGTGCLSSKGLLSGVTAGGCPEPYGCPYPTFPALGAGDQMTERVVQAFAAYDIWWVPPSDRKAIDNAWIASLAKADDKPHDPEVLRHYGGRTWTQWIAYMQDQRGHCKTNTCKAPLDREVSVAIDNYKADLDQTASDALSFEHIQAAAARIGGDLTTTAGIYAAAAAVNANKSDLIRGNLKSALTANKEAQKIIADKNQKLMEAIRTGKHINTVINYGALALGGALLASAIMKGRRS